MPFQRSREFIIYGGDHETLAEYCIKSLFGIKKTASLKGKRIEQIRIKSESLRDTLIHGTKIITY